MQRAQPSREGLSPPSRRPEVNRGATERIDRRFDGLEGCSSRRGSWLLPGGGFCLARPAKSAPRSLLVNRFAVLDVEEVNTDTCEPIDAPPSSALVRTALPRRPKWEKRLPRRLSANTLDAHGMSIILPIEIGTTDTSEVHSVKALLDSGAIGNFIDKDFVRTKGISTWNISCPIPVFNIDSSPNEAGQISEVVDVVLRYKTHSKRMLLAVSNLGKQSMILGYTWLKDHNPEVNWQTGEVQMNRCPSRYEGCRTIRKERASQRKMEARAVNVCRSSVTPRVNFLRKITFDMLYTNEFVIRVRSRALAIPSERTTI